MPNKKYNLLVKKWKIIINPYIILSAVTFLSLAPVNNFKIDEKFIFPNLDKIVHFSMYFGLSFSIFVYFIGKVIEKEKLMLYIFFFSSLYGALMEFIQHISNLGRNANFYDFLANEVGIILAIVVTRFLINSKSKRFHSH